MKNPRLILIVASLLALLGLSACGMMLPQPQSAATPLANLTSVTSQSGVFRVSYTPAVDPLPLNQLHTWTLKLETADGKPVDNAQIAVDGGMPAHGHGLPTQPQMTRALGDGRYTVEGFRFQMTGDWVVDLTITANGQMDRARFNFAIR